MSGFSRENIEVLRQYFLSDDEVNKQYIRLSVTASMLKIIQVVQDGFERNLEVSTIAAHIGAVGFEKELEQIQTEFYKNFSKSSSIEFEQELLSAIKMTEKESIKNRLKALEEDDSIDISDIEISSAITFIERASIKERLLKMDPEFREPAVAASEVYPEPFKRGAYAGIREYRDKKISASHIEEPDGSCLWVLIVIVACLLLGIGLWFFIFK